MFLDPLMVKSLFLLESESSHHAALNMLSTLQSVPGGLSLLRGLYKPRRQKPVNVMGLTFPNAVGLAAGYDKEAAAWKALGALGFGHVEIGTVTPRPQPGNPTPRVFRLTEDNALINRLGFPSLGSEVVLKRLSKDRPGGMVLGVNIGKNKDTPLEQAAEDYVALVHEFAEVADYLTVNVSSPNTPGLRKLQSGPALRALLRQVLEARDEIAASGKGRTPVAVKISPDLDNADLDDTLGAVLETGVDGLIVSNTTIGREGLRSPLKTEKGGMSGAALTLKAREMLTKVRVRIGTELPVISVGGIMTAAEARRRLDLGANLVQIYTGLVFQGPGLVTRAVEATSK